MRFSERVFGIVKRVPKCKVTTYGAIARRLDTSPRAVGQVLKRNKNPVVIPCHRVVCSDGSLGGYGGVVNSGRKAALLRKEGVEVKNNRIDMERFGWRA